jgi:hypothetical protein
MTPKELNDMSLTARLMNGPELSAWVASRKEVGGAMEIETADLKGEWGFEEDPYNLHFVMPDAFHRNHDDNQAATLYFVRMGSIS